MHLGIIELSGKVEVSFGFARVLIRRVHVALRILIKSMVISTARPNAVCRSIIVPFLKATTTTTERAEVYNSPIPQVTEKSPASQPARQDNDADCDWNLIQNYAVQEHNVKYSVSSGVQDNKIEMTTAAAVVVASAVWCEVRVLS